MIQSYFNKNLLEIVLKNNLIVYIHVVNVDLITEIICLPNFWQRKENTAFAKIQSF